MATDHHQNTYLNVRCCCLVLVFVSSISTFLVLNWSNFLVPCYSNVKTPSLQTHHNQPFNLLTFPSAWNSLHFPSQSPSLVLKIALFVKKWPLPHRAGGLERHALTLHTALAKRGHELHIFTPLLFNLTSPMKNLYFHFSKPTAGGNLDQVIVWKQFQVENSSRRPFDVVHTESVGLMHTRARELTNLAVSWHGIAYESIHSDIIQELLRDPKTEQPSVLTQGIMKVVEEVKFFPHYAHHVATSDHVGDILKRIYMIPEERVHIILNGVDEEVFKPQVSNFRSKIGIDKDYKTIVFGMAGRLVKDKGHPLMFEALRQIFNENSTFKDSVIIVVAGNGPWGDRYRELGPNLHVLGPMDRAQLTRFYNGIDIFVNPTLRAQGLDQICLEAMLVGKPLLATKVASITESVIVSKDIGYTFSPTVEALKKALYEVWNDGRVVLQKKGQLARKRGLQLFTATKMAAAFERLFLCIADNGNVGSDYCNYNPNLV